jgi:hypothetical protein
MSLPWIATREEWLAARKDLLAKEKNLTRQRDALNTERRNLPMVEIVKDYQFDGPDGRVRPSGPTSTSTSVSRSMPPAASTSTTTAPSTSTPPQARKA